MVKQTQAPFVSKKITKEMKGLESYNKCDALRDLVPFAQFKKRVKHPSRSTQI